MKGFLRPGLTLVLLVFATAPAYATFGACCKSDGACVITLPQECTEDLQGTFMGEGTTCDPNPCVEQACCLSDPEHTCTMVTLDACVRAGGSPRGVGTVCDPNPCASLGACCYEDGSCAEMTESDCLADGGTTWTQDVGCDPNPCVPASGACCFGDGTCVPDLTFAECDDQLGSYMGDGTVCHPSPCQQPEACCLPNGHCIVVTADECTGASGTPQGPEAVCEPNPCPQPTGACCLGNEQTECLVMTAAECATGQGTYRGDGTTCDPNPCLTPTRETTWGRIKTDYR